MDAISRHLVQEVSPDACRIHDWLTVAGLAGLSLNQLVSGLCDRLNGAGVRVARAHIATSTLHPLVRAYSYTWQRRDGSVEAFPIPHVDQMTDGWRKSPFAYMMNNNMFQLRCPLVGPDVKLDFPIFDELRAEGLTDWYGAAFNFGLEAVLDEARQIGLICSLASDRPRGFSETDLMLLEVLLPTVALAAKSIAMHEISRGLLATYLGGDAAQRVLSGTVRRGSVQSVPAVLFYADLRGFTQLADVTPQAELVSMLDDYLECMARPVESRGGQVLKFMGDGLLATFGLGDGDRPDVCATALNAANAALAAIEDLNRQREALEKPIMLLDIALHLGDVLYGNVGSDTRLDFTVVGPAVNEASRIEALCGPLNRNLLVSEAFASAATACRWRLQSLGRHSLRGVRDSTELFALADGVPVL